MIKNQARNIVLKSVWWGRGGAYPAAKYSKTLANLQNPDPWGMRWGRGILMFSVMKEKMEKWFI